MMDISDFGSSMPEGPLETLKDITKEINELVTKALDEQSNTFH
jgi:hypothetical protein